jgi:Type I restriction modification DNA specificity domain.
MELANKEWKPFVLGQIFEIEPCKCSKVTGIGSGQMPYVGATNRNNGVLNFINPVSSLITKGNCIAFICDGEGSIGYSIYKSEDFIGSTTVKVGRNENLNRHIGMFISTIADTVRSKYNFGFKRNTEHLRKEILLLPVNAKGEPDYAFMENYMRQKETELLKQYKKQVSEFESIVPLSEKEWIGFEIGKLFKISAGKSKGLNHLQNITKGGINYLGATNSNNGVLAYVQKVEPMTHRGNSICFIRNGEGSMGFSVYKAEDFIATSDISVGYADFLNKYVGLFITTVADKVRGKYNFGYKRNETRLKKEKILLPINSHGKPDYAYMENYMKALESEKITQYLEYKKQKRTTKMHYR